MKKITEPLRDKAQTARRMYELIDRFYGDIDYVRIRKGNRTVPISQLSISEYFDLVRSIPYKRDAKPIEVVGRPIYIFGNADKGMDCKKKAIAMGAYFKYHAIPFRLIGSSRRKDKRVHHVFPQAMLQGEYRNMDATYPDYEMFEGKPETTYAEVL